MEELLIVDGYNIINAWRELKELMPLGLESARQALIDVMADYSGSEGTRVIIVFDAQGRQGAAREEMVSGVRVVFSAEGETADAAIERMASEQRGYRRWVRVATSDGIEQSVILGFGATRVSARELKGMIDQAKRKRRDYMDTRSAIKANPLRERLKPEIARKLENLRRKDG